MPKVLITAFEPYGTWIENSSWLTLIELTKEIPSQLALTTRLYPVDFDQLRERLTKDLEVEYDAIIHLGQAPGSSAIQLEMIGLNLRAQPEEPENVSKLAEGGPMALQSDMPLRDWAARLREASVPARVSYHAGTYLCNAALYFSLLHQSGQSRPSNATFVHLPLAPKQVASSTEEIPTMLPSQTSSAIRMILDEIAL